MNLLTRELIEDFIPLALKQVPSVDTDGGHHTVYDALSRMIDHDAEQRRLSKALDEQIVKLTGDIRDIERQRNVALLKLEEARACIQELKSKQ